jgi:hypothetical protein
MTTRCLQSLTPATAQIRHQSVAGCEPARLCIVRFENEQTDLLAFTEATERKNKERKKDGKNERRKVGRKERRVAKSVSPGL